MPNALLSATLKGTIQISRKDAVLLHGKYEFMQIEKHDEKNLYCYITEDDLRDLEIFFDDLAYGSNSFRKLLSAIMKRAGEECLFADLPVLAEAVPLDNQELFIQISAIDEAEELDPRFAQFSPSIFEELDLEDDEETAAHMEPAGETYNIPENDGGAKPAFSAVPDTRRIRTRPAKGTVYTFGTYETLLLALLSSGSAGQFTQTRSALYYHPEKKNYYLVLHQHQNTAPIRALLASLCEYADARPLTPSVHAWLTEHCRCLIRSHAVSRLMEAVEKK